MPLLTEHFALEEFTNSTTALALGIENTPTTAHMKNLQKLAEGMEKVRALFGKVIEITSGYRNPEVNKAVGGVKNSAHALGFAADFHVHGIEDLKAAKVIRDSGIVFDQLIYERSRCVHIAFGPGKRQMVLSQPGGPGSPTQPGLRK